MGSNTDGILVSDFIAELICNSAEIEVRSVGNSAVLKETCLVEAFNLKVRARGI